MDLISIIVVLLATFIGLIGAIYAYGKAHIREIKDNWVQYRCNPLYMPMANFVGSDIVTNFTNCTMKNVQSYTGFVMDPIYQNFRSFQEIFSSITESMNFIRKQMAGTSNGFLAIINSVFGKMQNTMSTTSQLVGRIRTLNKRIIGTFVTMMHIAKTGIQTGESIHNGPIGRTAEFFCFHPDTPIVLKNGKSIPIKDVKPLMILKDDSQVYSILEFDGKETPMVLIDNITVSKNHKILRDNKWIRAEDHPDAVEVESIDKIYCLNTDSHKIVIDEHTFKDYEETDNTDEFNKDVVDFYECSHIDRSVYKITGFHEDTLIILKDYNLVRIKDVKIGDLLIDNIKVIGIIKHNNEDGFVEIENRVLCSPGTLIFDTFGKLELAHTLGKKYIYDLEDSMYYQLLTESALVPLFSEEKVITIALDDQEVISTTIHAKRDALVIDEKITDS